MRFLRHVTGTNTFCIRSKTVLSVSHALYVRFIRCASVTCTVHTLLVRYLSCTRSVAYGHCAFYAFYTSIAGASGSSNYDFHHRKQRMLQLAFSFIH